MDTEQFKQFAGASLDFIADYCENIRDLPVLPDVEPGYLSRKLPQTAPKTGESWKDIMEDIKSSILPGLTQWHSPYFHAFFPTGQSYPAIIGELFMAGIGATVSNW
ncbi:hypothetical protein GWI33_017627, partial [Rhynchophorus ferrugineus]